MGSTKRQRLAWPWTRHWHWHWHWHWAAPLVSVKRLSRVVSFRPVARQRRAGPRARGDGGDGVCGGEGADKRQRSTAGERDGDPGQTRRMSIPHNRWLLVVMSSPGRDMDAAPGPRRASDIHPSILLSLEELAAVWAARPVTCRPDEVLQAPVFWNSHHVGHEGSECDDRHRDDVRLRWHGWMQGPWSVWQMPIPEPMRLIQSPRPSPPCPQIREPPRQPHRCRPRVQHATDSLRDAGSPSLGPWHLALCLLLHRGSWAAVDALPPSAARRQGRQLVAKRDCDSTLASGTFSTNPSLSSLNAPVSGGLDPRV